MKTPSSLCTIFAIALLAQFLYFTTWIVPVDNASIIISGLLILRKYACRTILGWNCWLACCTVKPVAVSAFGLFFSMKMLLTLCPVKRASGLCVVHIDNNFSVFSRSRRLFAAEYLSQELETWTFLQFFVFLGLCANWLAPDFRWFVYLDVNLTLFLWFSLKCW